MSIYGSRDFLVEVAKGNVPGHSIVNKWGHNESVGTTPEDIFYFGGQLAHLTAADTFDVVAVGTNDTSTGTGMRTVVLEGLDSSWNLQSETISLSGTTPVTSANSYIRVFRLSGDTCGTYGNANLSLITCSDTTGGNPHLQIAVDNNENIGQSQTTHYTIPAGKTGYLLNYNVSAETSKPVIVFAKFRQNADDVTVPYSATRTGHIIHGVEGQQNYTFDAPVGGYLPAKTDIWFRARVAVSGTAAVTVNYQLLLVDD